MDSDWFNAGSAQNTARTHEEFPALLEHAPGAERIYPSSKSGFVDTLNVFPP